MNTKMLTPALAAIAFLAGGNAIADHELIVTPAPHTVQPHAEVPTRTHAEPEVRYRGPYLTTYLAGGYGWGGDVMGRFTDNFGDTDRIRSGGGFLLEGGLLAALDRSTMLRLTAGYEADATGRDNGYSTFDRVRFDLMLLRNFGVQELGVGLTTHTGVGFHCDINSICAGDIEFDNAFGYTVEYALTSFDNLGFGHSKSDRRLHPLRSARLGLRYTDIEYIQKPDLAGVAADNEVDGRSLSLFAGFVF